MYIYIHIYTWCFTYVSTMHIYKCINEWTLKSEWSSVHMYIHWYICIVHTYIFMYSTHIHIHVQYTHTYSCTPVHEYVCVYNAYIPMYIHMHTWYICTHFCTHIHIHIQSCTLGTYVYTLVYMHCTHIHIHVQVCIEMGTSANCYIPLRIYVCVSVCVQVWMCVCRCVRTRLRKIRCLFFAEYSLFYRALLQKRPSQYMWLQTVD